MSIRVVVNHPRAPGGLSSRKLRIFLKHQATVRQGLFRNNNLCRLNFRIPGHLFACH